MQGQDFFGDYGPSRTIPEDVIDKILHGLERSDVKNLNLVNRFFHKFIENKDENQPGMALYPNRRLDVNMYKHFDMLEKKNINEVINKLTPYLNWKKPIYYVGFRHLLEKGDYGHTGETFWNFYEMVFVGPLIETILIRHDKLRILYYSRLNNFEYIFNNEEKYFQLKKFFNPNLSEFLDGPMNNNDYNKIINYFKSDDFQPFRLENPVNKFKLAILRIN